MHATSPPLDGSEPLDEMRRRLPTTPPLDRRVAPRRGDERLGGRRLDDLGPTDTLRLLAAVLDRETRLDREPLVGDSFLKPGWDA